jgi:glucuronate isomerase
MMTEGYKSTYMKTAFSRQEVDLGLLEITKQDKDCMARFNDKDFLLSNDYGKKLYHDVAAALPIIDPHNHIDPAAIASNRQFENIYQLWVQHDPYKHRAMRIFGIPEQLITGDAPDYDKFLAWAKCFQSTLGNPLFHWSCMELKELFEIEEILTPANAKEIWDEANTALATEEYFSANILIRFNVESLCTSDDLLDTLEHHLSLSKQDRITCLPSLRSDSIIAFNAPAFLDWLHKLEVITSTRVTNITSYKKAIVDRIDFFDNAGCLLADHSLDSGFVFIPTEEDVAEKLFERLLQQQALTVEELIQLQSHFLQFLGEEYYRRQWKMQLHIGSL